MKKVRTPDLRKLARRQRWILWLVLLAAVPKWFAMPPGTSFDPVLQVALVVVQLTIYILMVAGVAFLMAAARNHPILIVLCSLLMVAPCVNLLVLVLVNRSATRALRRAGLRVRFMGVRDEEVERALDPSLCKGCGYNLTGNVSGVCPECGRPIAPVAT